LSIGLFILEQLSFSFLRHPLKKDALKQHTLVNKKEDKKELKEKTSS